MKPPVDWSPCQQKGEEHIWLPMRINNNINGLSANTLFWWCGACGIFLVDLNNA